MHLWFTPEMSSRVLMLDKLKSALQCTHDTSTSCHLSISLTLFSYSQSVRDYDESAVMLVWHGQLERTCLQTSLIWLGSLSASVLLTQQFSQYKRQYQKQEQYWLSLTCWHFYIGDRSCGSKDLLNMLTFFGLQYGQNSMLMQVFT